MHKHRDEGFLFLSLLRQPLSFSLSLSIAICLPLSLLHLSIYLSRSLSYCPRFSQCIVAAKVRSLLLFLSLSLSFRRRYPTCAASGNAVHYIPGVLSCLPVLFAAVAVARSGALLRTFEKTSLPRFFILDRGRVPRRRHGGRGAYF